MKYLSNSLTTPQNALYTALKRHGHSRLHYPARRHERNGNGELELLTKVRGLFAAESCTDLSIVHQV